MPNEGFAGALRSLDAPYYLDDTGRDIILGVEYRGTSHDGSSVAVVRLHDRIVKAMKDIDLFVGTLGARAHRGPGAGSLLGAGVTPTGDVFVVGPWSDGVLLAAHLASDGIVPSKRLRNIAVQSLSRLDEYRAAGVCHGMVMPQTVVLDKHDGVLLRWGGLFTALRVAGISPADIARLTAFGSYLAPELLRGDSEGVQSDVFSLGATLYEALTGRPPFGGRTTATVMAAVLADENDQPERISGDSFRTAILRAIEQDPHDRWRDSGHLREALTSALPVAIDVATGKKGCLSTVVLAVITLVALSVFS